MPEYLSPGVYVEEISTGPKPIEGVSTSVAGFLGPTERGPEDIRYITSFIEFNRWYGNHLGVDKSFLSYAVQGFFDNGGKRCFIGRIVGGVGGNAPAPPPAKVTIGNVNVLACGRGDWGNFLYIRVTEASKARTAKDTDPAKKWIRVQVLYVRTSDGTPAAVDNIADPFQRPPETSKDKLRAELVEDFDDLSLESTAANYAITAVNSGSRLIRLDLPQTAGNANIPQDPKFQPLAGGTGNLPQGREDYVGKLEPNDDSKDQLLGFGSGMVAMNTVDGVSLLMIPDEVHPNFGFNGNLTTDVVTACEQLRDRFAILSTPKGFTVSKLANGTMKLNHDTTYGALYHPWIWVYDPLTRDDQLIPPTGHVAGIIARTDLDQGVFKAPANAVVNGAKDLEYPLTKGDQDVFNPVGVNCIRDFRSDRRGVRLWGARTMSSDPEWKYVNVRRLFLYIEESIDEGTQWVVFEGNNEVTWGRVTRSITNFLTTVWKAGGLFGTKPEEAFFVRCDRSTMDEDDIQNGRLVCYIGICPVRPAEFVIFRIGQKTADATS